MACRQHLYFMLNAFFKKSGGSVHVLGPKQTLNQSIKKS